MKKILLSLGLFSLVIFGSSQTVLNETFGNPGAGNSEFIELYNSAPADQNVNCFTIVTYWESGGNKGVNILDLPNKDVDSKGWFVIAANSPFSSQGTGNTSITPDVNWNNISFRDGTTGGYYKKFQLNGTLWTDITPADNVIVDEIMVGTLNGNQNYFTFLFQNGVFINGFWGSGSSSTLPTDITGMPTLMNIPLVGCLGTTSFNINFSTLGPVEHKNASGGSNNGYARTSDGKCGAWDKTAAGTSHTPGRTNGSATTSTTTMTTVESINCSVPRYILFDITGLGTGGATLADDFPVDFQLYFDRDNNNILSAADTLYRTKQIVSVVAPSDTIQIQPPFQNTQKFIVVYKTQRGCFDKVASVVSACAPLPVDFKSFTATRNKANVMLKWTTSTEKNNSGFAVERNVDNATWEEVAFVRSQALSGNSDLDLMYQYIDNNNSKGISQYRIRQVDFDSRSKFSEIRSVKGDGQIGAVIVYPNPSADGRINVVFDNATVVRNIVVMDMSGRTIKQIYGVSNNNITIDNLMPGMYSLRIFVPETGEQTVKKIIVNKR